MKSGEHDPIKILHIASVPYQLNYLTGQVGYIADKGIEVHVLCSPGELMDEFAKREHVQAHGVHISRMIAPFSDLRSIFQIIKKIRKIKPTIVQAYTPKAGLLGMISAWLTGVPVRIYNELGLPIMTARGWKRALLWWCEKITCTLAHRVISISSSLSDVVIKENLCPADKIKVLHYGSIGGIDTVKQFNPDVLGEATHNAVRAKYGIAPDALVIGYLGRIVSEKGLVELVNAWKTLRYEFGNLHLFVVGPFEPHDPLPDDVERLLRTDSRITLVGLEWNTGPMYSAMDVLAFPSYREGFGLVAVEASAMEIPVVGTNIPGIVDSVQDGVTGMLIPARDSEALTNALRTYLQNPDLRIKHGKAGRERVLKCFAQEDMWRATYDEYMSLLNENGLAVSETADQERIAA